ncbi:MAG: hypothetical protein QCI82_00100 [Candidatus Thermoplasmatota archaeon]|nr:hypothetical protein [Candidatus Thermoplasmatota archaeon]
MGDEGKALDSGKRRGPDPRGIYPIRQNVRWVERKGIIVLIYPKDFSALERRLHSLLGGPTEIRRPLDDVGTMLWRLSDGDHDLLSIYLAEQKSFGERVEPVDKVVGGLLETMLKLGLMRLEYRDPNGK